MYDDAHQRDPGRNRRSRPNDLRQGHRRLDQRRAAESDAVRRRDDLGPACRACQRPECRPAPHARHRAPDSSAPAIRFRSASTSCRSGAPAFDFPALTYFSERPSDRIPYITLFPVGKRMRANLFAYREADDPWLREMRRNPVETLNAALPRLSPHHRRIRRCRRHQYPPGRPLCLDGISPGRASSWSATPLQPPALSPAPAPTRCSPTSASSATSISPPGLPPKAWARPRSRRSTTIRSRRHATPGRWRKPSASARSRSTPGSTGGRSAGRASWPGSAKASCDGYARRSARHQRRALIPRRHPRRHLFIVFVGLTGRIVRRVALVVPELAVGAVAREQFGMRAALDRLAARDHDDLVHLDHRGQAVRRPDHGAALRRPSAACG